MSKLASLRVRILVVTLATALAAAATAFAGLVWLTGRQLDRAVDEGLRARAADIGAARARGDEQALAGDPFAQVLGADGAVLAHSPAAPAQPVLAVSVLQAAADRGRVLEAAVPELGGAARVAAVPMSGGTVVVGTGLRDFDAAHDRLFAMLLAAVGVLIAALGAGAWALLGAALRPVGRMSRAAEVMSGAEAGQRLPAPRGHDEIALLGRTFNHLLDRVDAARARERRFLDDASHELRTPLTVLRGELELALDEPDPEALRAGVRVALAETERLTDLAEGLLVLAREHGGQAPLHREPVDLGAWLRTALPGLRGPASAALAVSVDAPAGVAVAIDPTALRRILGNLVDNAARAGASAVSLSLAVDGGEAVLDADDDGPGFAAEILPRAFERFARADSARTRGSGNGLGLAIVAALVRGHGGTVTAANASPLGGARVRVRLPVVGAP